MRAPEDRATRRAVQRLDRVALGEARKVFATSRNVADRLQRSTGIDAEVMPHPPQELPYRTESYDDFVLSVGRLDRAKRHRPAARRARGRRDAALRDRRRRPDRERLEDVARKHGLDGRARFTGRVDEEELADALRALPRRLLRAGRRGLRDGSLRGVPRREAGRHDDRRRRPARGRRRSRDRASSIEPRAAALAEACSWLRDHVDDAQAWGRAGKEIARRVSWDETIARLLA